MSRAKGPSSKTCYQCHETKQTDKFAQRSTKGLRAYRNICNECWKKQRRGYRSTDEFRSKMKAKARVLRASEEFREHEKTMRLARNASSPDTVFRMAIHNARARAPVALMKADLWDMWNKQQGRCALTGIQMTWAKGKIMPTSISLDRIEPSLGYQVGNVRFICHAVNAFKGGGNDEQVLIMARAIVAQADRESFPSAAILSFAA